MKENLGRSTKHPLFAKMEIRAVASVKGRTGDKGH